MLAVSNFGHAALVAQQPDEVAIGFKALKQSVNSTEHWRAWQDFIKPSESDLKWQETPWLPTFKEGIFKAAKEDKPVLLWTMNGHPLGCT